MPVAQMTVANAIVAVRGATGHDADTQVTDTQITAELDREYRRVRRWLSSFVPSLYQVELDNINIASGSNAIAKPDDFERVIVLERQMNQGVYCPLAMRPTLHQRAGIAIDVSGLYRLTYVSRPVDGYTAFNVPEGCEDIITCMVSAWVCARHQDDPSYWKQRADELRNEVRPTLKMRYGAHPRCMLQATPSTYQYLTWFEEGSNLIVC